MALGFEGLSLWLCWSVAFGPLHGKAEHCGRAQVMEKVSQFMVMGASPTERGQNKICPSEAYIPPLT